MATLFALLIDASGSFLTSVTRFFVVSRAAIDIFRCTRLRLCFDGSPGRRVSFFCRSLRCYRLPSNRPYSFQSGKCFGRAINSASPSFECHYLAQHINSLLSENLVQPSSSLYQLLDTLVQISSNRSNHVPPFSNRNLRAFAEELLFRGNCKPCSVELLTVTVLIAK